MQTYSFNDRITKWMNVVAQHKNMIVITNNIVSRMKSWKIFFTGGVSHTCTTGQTVHLSICPSLDPEGHRGTTDDLATSCVNLCLSSTAFCGLKSPVVFTLWRCLSLLLCSTHNALPQDGLYHAGWLGDMSVPHLTNRHVHNQLLSSGLPENLTPKRPVTYYQCWF